MKAISIKQPWAWLIVNGIKDIENRTWSTDFRGHILIHASKKFDLKSLEFWRQKGLSYYQSMVMASPNYKQPKFERGGIIGIAEIVDCVTKSDSIWFEEPFGFVLTNARPLSFKACRGKLGLFEVEYDFKLSGKE